MPSQHTRTTITGIILSNNSECKTTMVSSDAFKQVMRRWASTVTIITTKAGDTIYGLTATAFSSLSVKPLQIQVDQLAELHAGRDDVRLIKRAGAYTVAGVAFS